jgi:hypothetical protein
MTKAWYDAQHNPPPQEPPMWGFPGAGILLIVGLVFSFVAAGYSIYTHVKIETRHECYRDLTGRDY